LTPPAQGQPTLGGLLQYGDPPTDNENGIDRGKDEGPRSDPVQRALRGCGSNTNGASVKSAYTRSNVTISVKHVLG
jgi:hypothetical protein